VAVPGLGAGGYRAGPGAGGRGMRRRCAAGAAGCGPGRGRAGGSGARHHQRPAAGGPGHGAGPGAGPGRADVGVGGGIPGQCRREAEPGQRGAGLRQLPHRRRRGAAVVAAPGARHQQGHRLQPASGGLHRPAGGADRRARPGVGDPAAPAAGHRQHPDGAAGRLRRHSLYLGRPQARRSRRDRARRHPKAARTPTPPWGWR
jgi:hypothetical protein